MRNQKKKPQSTDVADRGQKEFEQTVRLSFIRGVLMPPSGDLKWQEG